MKNLILRIFTFTILMGIVALAINTVFGRESILFLTKERHLLPDGSAWYMWKFNWLGYVQNIQTTAADASVLQFKLPQIDLTDFLGVLKTILNFVILLINILLYPFRASSYFLQNILALLGVNQDTSNINNGLAWLITFIRDILGNIAIPYV